jgi:hypothetical protein
MKTYHIEGKFDGDFTFIVKASNEDKACDNAVIRLHGMFNNMFGASLDDYEVVSLEEIARVRDFRRGGASVNAKDIGRADEYTSQEIEEVWTDLSRGKREERIEQIVSTILAKDGHEGRTEGSHVITDFILAICAGEAEAWFDEYQKRITT